MGWIDDFLARLHAATSLPEYLLIIIAMAFLAYQVSYQVSFGLGSLILKF